MLQILVLLLLLSHFGVFSNEHGIQNVVGNASNAMADGKCLFWKS